MKTHPFCGRAAALLGLWLALVLAAEPRSFGQNVIAWGSNTQGQANVPASATNVFSVAAGWYHSMALRADGSVVGRDIGKSLFEGDLSKLRLYPGDAIVVPEKDVRPSGLNQLMLWTQFLSQLSLNSVEFSVLK